MHPDSTSSVSELLAHLGDALDRGDDEHARRVLESTHLTEDHTAIVLGLARGNTHDE